MYCTVCTGLYVRTLVHILGRTASYNTDSCDHGYADRTGQDRSHLLAFASHRDEDHPVGISRLPFAYS